MRLLVFATVLSLTVFSQAKTPAPETKAPLTEIAYKSGESLTSYEKDRCKLDVYLPEGVKDFPTLVWFHGGGLKTGDKGGTEDDSAKTPLIARSFTSSGVAVVAANYRLSPKATYPAYIEDAAAAVAWTVKNIAEQGGDPRKIFVGGHSAGGYLAMMLGMDVHYLGDAGVKPTAIAGYIPVSGQAMTHYTVREERGIGRYNVTADEAAPIRFTRKNTQPFLVLYGDHDMPSRAEENAFFVAHMQSAGNKVITGKQIADRTHGSIAAKMANEDDPAKEAALEFIRAKSGSR